MTFVPSSAAPSSGDREMRPGRFELPRSKWTTRPSTLRAACPSFPTAAETHIRSGTMDDLDLADSPFVVTVLSRKGGATGCAGAYALRPWQTLPARERASVRGIAHH